MSPNSINFLDERLPSRLWERIAPEPNSGCWLWFGALTTAGYPNARVGSRTLLMHRYVYRLLVGEIPDGMSLDHLCRTPCCVNPLHLEPVSHYENMRRGRAWKLNQEKTHCPHGHEYTGENLIILKTGSRACRECHRRTSREYAAARRKVITWPEIVGES